MSKLLPPKVRKSLLKGLRSAFPDIGTFDSFLRTSLNKERTNYVADTMNLSYPQQIEKVLCGAENEDWVEQLIKDACSEQPTNQDLKKAAELYEKHKAKSPSTHDAPEAYSSWVRSKTGREFPGVFLISRIVLVGIVAVAGWGLYSHLTFKPVTEEVVRQSNLEELARSIASDLSTNGSIVNSKSWESDSIKATFELTEDCSSTFVARDYALSDATIEFNIMGEFSPKKFEGDIVNIRGKIQAVEKISSIRAKVYIQQAEFIDLPISN